MMLKVSGFSTIIVVRRKTLQGVFCTAGIRTKSIKCHGSKLLFGKSVGKSRASGV